MPWHNTCYSIRIMQLRDYQRRAITEVVGHLSAGRSPLLVAPTGAGKTVMGAEVVRRYGAVRALVVVHRHTLAEQSRRAFPRGCSVQTVQTLLQRGVPEHDLLVLDEAHHYTAQEWQKIVGDAPRVGLTATPERSDGRPMRGLFDQIVVAAQYPDLVRDGYLVPCRVFRPKEALDTGLALDPVEAYRRHGKDRRAMAFVSTIKGAHQLAKEFRDAGIPAESIVQDTPEETRLGALARLEDGSIRILVNVYTLTEGVDVPIAGVCLLARGCSHVTPYLQMVGRVLRPAAGKTEAILIDLPGVSYRHGLPTEARDYSLGDGILKDRLSALRVCLRCGMTHESTQCPSCGYVAPPQTRRGHRIFDMDLAEVYEEGATPDWAKTREWARLQRLGKPVEWGVRQFRKLFGHAPPLNDDERREILAVYKSIAAKRGYKPGYAAARYRTLTGDWPRRGL